MGLEETTTRSGPEPLAEVREVLVVTGASSWRVALPASGRVVIGRAPDAELRVDDESVSRRHAMITTRDSEVTISDLGSHNGTRVNGEPLAAMRRLWAGDVVQVGDVVVVVYGVATQAPPAIDGDDLRRRLADEIERAAAFDRTAGVIAFAGVPDRAVLELRALDRIGPIGGRLVAVVPELDRDALATYAAGAIAKLAGARAGFAQCPDDGADPGALIAAACAAADVAEPGRVVDAATIATTIAQASLADPAMLRLVELTRRVARGGLAVLVVGETGAGKELVARGVHQLGPRAGGPFVALNCAAVQDSLVESELFGFDKGAFTGAGASKPGLFEAADGGTLLLDEVGELSAAMQAKLLRAIDSGRFTRIGSVVERAVDVRIVAATNRHLETEVAAGRFRADLYYRLSGATIAIPPLRDRPRDIALLARAFLSQACERLGREPPRITAGAMLALSRYAWPGNVRELRNVMEHIAAIEQNAIVGAWSLPPKVTGDPADATQPVSQFRLLADEVAELEQRRMREAIAACDGVLKSAAQRIGMPLRTFHMKAKQYGLTGRRRED